MPTKTFVREIVEKEATADALKSREDLDTQA
jgi:hypothetical protein